MTSFLKRISNRKTSPASDEAKANSKKKQKKERIPRTRKPLGWRLDLTEIYEVNEALGYAPYGYAPYGLLGPTYWKDTAGAGLYAI